MSDLIAGGHNPDSGFNERAYVVLAQGVQPEHRFGYIQLHAAPRTTNR